VVFFVVFWSGAGEREREQRERRAAGDERRRAASGGSARLLCVFFGCAGDGAEASGVALQTGQIGRASSRRDPSRGEWRLADQFREGGERRRERELLCFLFSLSLSERKAGMPARAAVPVGCTSPLSVCVSCALCLFCARCGSKTDQEPPFLFLGRVLSTRRWTWFARSLCLLTKRWCVSVCERRQCVL
jgi:hypothetical protein